MKETKIALGTWAWGAGAFGGDMVFGSTTDEVNLKPVFDAAMKAGLNLWDTATVYGMGESERILGTLIKSVNRDDVLISREVDGKMEFTRINLTKDELYASPYYYLQQNDVVYVSPNAVRTISSSNVGLWLSTVSTLASAATVIVTVLNYANKK